MDEKRWSEVKTVFHAALECPTDRRAELLEKLCGEDADLRHEVEKLVESDERAGEFLEHPATDPAPVESMPERIGPYAVVRSLGHGGMGEVYLAREDTATRRDVAIKVIRSGFISEEISTRFEAEQRALALMDHRGIAKIYTAGTTEDDRPYYVMEFVPGTDIVTYCDSHSLDVRSRVALLLEVCDALGHAHAQGVVHRDLKPSNILIVETEEGIAPKVIDFGIAKSLSQKLTTETLHTQAGFIVGTPEYMSPEQADPLNTSINASTDVYSLGVILYQLLTGTHPFGLGTPDGEALRTNFPLPSERVVTTDSDQVARQRRTSMDKLTRELRGSLDFIVVTALQFDREGRYRSAASLASDIRRYLSGRRVATSKRRMTPSTTIVLSFVTFAAMSLLLWLWLQPRPATIDSSVEITGRGIRVLSTSGRTQWRRPFSLERKMEAYGKLSSQHATRWLIADTLGDEAVEVFFVEMRADAESVLWAFDATGQELWHIPFGVVDHVKEPGPIDAPFGPMGKTWIAGTTRSGDSRYLVVVAPARRYPTRLLLVEPSDGSIVSEYVHPGHVATIAARDIDADGRDELLVGGMNNPGNGDGHAAFFALDVPFTKKARVRDRHFFGEQYEVEFAYLLFPQVQEGYVDSIVRINVLSEQHLELVLHTRPGDVFYKLTWPQLDLLAVDPSDEFRRKLQDVPGSDRILDRLDRVLKFESAPDGNSPEVAARFE